MRTLLIPLLLITLPAIAANPEKLYVVVHTADRVMVDYSCSTFLSETDPTRPVFKSVLQSAGMFNWHATGGTKPYRVINSTEGAGGGCITVMDADGNTATGCGVIGDVHVRRNVDCGNMSDSTLTPPLPPLPQPKEESAYQIVAVPPTSGTPPPIDPYTPTKTPTVYPPPTTPPTIGPHTPTKTPTVLPPPPPPPTIGPYTPTKTPTVLPPPPIPPVNKKADQKTSLTSTPRVPPTVGTNRTPSHIPVQRSAPSHGTTTHGPTPSPHPTTRSGGGFVHGSSRSTGQSSNGGTNRTSPAPN